MSIGTHHVWEDCCGFIPMAHKNCVFLCLLGIDVCSCLVGGTAAGSTAVEPSMAVSDGACYFMECWTRWDHVDVPFGARQTQIG